MESLALGGTHGGVTNLELTAAYAAIANNGIYTEPYLYTRILARDGTVLLSHTPERWEAVRASTADLLTSAMEDVLTSGTGTEAAFSGQSLAGKSGTTSDRRDLWFVGFSPVCVCGVWSGYDDNGTQKNGSLVKSVWRAIMERAHDGLPDVGFARDLEQRTICTKCGQLAVDGLCNDTVQGNMARVEYFAPGTAPTLHCDCHVRLTLCDVSGKKAGLYCRSRTSQVYLKEGTPGTADAEAVCPSAAECDIHGTWWDWLLPGERGEEELPPPEPPAEERGDNRWSYSEDSWTAPAEEAGRRRWSDWWDWF